jgi:hypothetical protein
MSLGIRAFVSYGDALLRLQVGVTVAVTVYLIPN